MSRVLKKNSAPDAPTVHSLASAWATTREGSTAAALPLDPERQALQAEADALHARLAQYEAQQVELTQQARSAFERGEAKGREAGLREAEDQEAKRLAHLENAIAQAQHAFKSSLADLERLAPVLAHEALARVLAPSDGRSLLVTAILGRQLAAIEAGSVMHVDVSAADFPDDLALEALQGTLGTLGPLVHASVSLRSGDCRIRLKLGTLDVGLDQQWGRLSALLHEMAAPGEGGA